ncbi:MAG: hypothetical protein U5N56_12670 [Candidatus Marinimicrobia bacterium]|nr:hypothetical protein [Candidatus Neomarinimicrobiota bacterium]
MADIKRADVLAYLESANMLEISELIKEIEREIRCNGSRAGFSCGSTRSSRRSR